MIDPGDPTFAAGRGAPGRRKGDVGSGAPSVGSGCRRPSRRVGEGACGRESDRRVSGIRGAKRSPGVESPGVVPSGGLPPGGRSAGKPETSLLFLGKKLQPAPCAAAPVSPPGFSELAEPPPARPPPSEHVFAHRRAGAAELFLPHCESRNELEASRARLLLLVQGAGGL